MNIELFSMYVISRCGLDKSAEPGIGMVRFGVLVCLQQVYLAMDRAHSQEDHDFADIADALMEQMADK